MKTSNFWGGREEALSINQIFQQTFTQPWCSRCGLPMLRRLHLLNLGLQAEVPGFRQNERNPLSDTRDDERKEECGTWAMRETEGEKDYSREEEQKEQEGGGESLHSPSVHKKVWLLPLTFTMHRLPSCTFFFFFSSGDLLHIDGLIFPSAPFCGISHIFISSAY